MSIAYATTPFYGRAVVREFNGANVKTRFAFHVDCAVAMLACRVAGHVSAICAVHGTYSGPRGGRRARRALKFRVKRLNSAAARISKATVVVANGTAVLTDTLFAHAAQSLINVVTLMARAFAKSRLITMAKHHASVAMVVRAARALKRAIVSNANRRNLLAVGTSHNHPAVAMLTTTSATNNSSTVGRCGGRRRGVDGGGGGVVMVGGDRDNRDDSGRGLTGRRYSGIVRLRR